MRTALLLVFASCSLSCGDTPDAAPACVAEADAGCQPQYLPASFSTVFEKILKPTCATGGGSCHGRAGAKGGMVFEDPDEAYAYLLGQRGGAARVAPGDPACSLLTRRLAASDPSMRMPPGPTPLSPGEICTVTQWIAAGASR